MIHAKIGKLPVANVVLAMVGLYALYFAGLGSYPLVDSDEPVYGQVAKEMAAGAGWLTPHYDGKPWFDKPPLFYWLSAGCVKLLGSTELAVRLPSAVLAVGVLVWLYLLVAYDFGRRAAVLACIAMATCIQQIVLARAAVTDMTFVFCLAGSLYAYRRWFGQNGGEQRADSREPRAGNYGLFYPILCGGMAGLAMLAKGPVGPLLLLVTFAIHLCCSGRLRRLISVDAFMGIAAALIVGMPWYVAMYAVHRGAFVQGFIVANNLTRFIKPEHPGTTGGWYSYFLNVPVLFVFFFPWSVFLLPGLLRYRAANTGSRLAAVWFAVVFVFFSLSKTQLVTYIFPVYPSAALFVGVLLDRAASEESATARCVKVCLITAVAASVLVTAVLVAIAGAKYPAARTPAACIGGVLVAATVVALTQKPDRAALICGTGMVAFASILICSAVPRVAAVVSTRDIARSVRLGPSDQVAEYGLRRPSLLFYLGFTPRHLRTSDEVKRVLAGNVSTWVICKDGQTTLVETEGCRIIRKGGFALIANEAAARRERLCRK